MLYIILLHAIALPVILQQNYMENTLAKEAEKVVVYDSKAKHDANLRIFTV